MRYTLRTPEFVVVPRGKAGKHSAEDSHRSEKDEHGTVHTPHFLFFGARDRLTDQKIECQLDLAAVDGFRVFTKIQDVISIP